MTVLSLVFPSFLSTPAYENKKVTFKALKPTMFDPSDANVAANALKETIDYVGSKGKGGQIAADVIDNIKNNGFGIPDGFNLDSSVTLPYPTSLSDNQQHNWVNTEGAIAQITNNILSPSKGGSGGNGGKGGKGGKQSKIAKAKNFTSEFLKKVLGDGKKVYGAALNEFGTRKAIIDPGYFQNYNGSTPRSFTMASTLVPQSQQEAQTFKDIILWFKQYSSPTFVSNTPIMGAPFIFNISFAGNQYITDMFKMDKCVLTGISVDYASDGSFMLYKDGFPKQIGLTLNFAEAEIKYAQDYAGLVKKTIPDNRSNLGSKGNPNNNIKRRNVFIPKNVSTP